MNPIGGISKTDLRKFIAYASIKFDFPILDEFLNAAPTAELEPLTESHVQEDEVDMGFTYNDLSILGSLRKISRCGPVSMFQSLLQSSGKGAIEVAGLVKKFFYYYGINRHKTTILTPSYHMSAYSPDDNRFDMRPILYTGWSWQFKSIDDLVAAIKKNDVFNQFF